MIRLLITTAAQQLTAAKTTLVAMRKEMLNLAKQLPEYETVQAMYGVGEVTATQLMAQIGDVRLLVLRKILCKFEFSSDKNSGNFFDLQRESKEWICS